MHTDFPKSVCKNKSNNLSNVIYVTEACTAPLPEVSAVMWGMPCSSRESSSKEEMFLVRDIMLPTALEFTTPDFFTTYAK